jgi:hypothetical protein
MWPYFTVPLEGHIRQARLYMKMLKFFSVTGIFMEPKVYINEYYMFFFLIWGFCVKWKDNGGKNVALFWAYEQMFSLPHEIWGIMDSDGSYSFALQGATSNLS